MLVGLAVPQRLPLDLEGPVRVRADRPEGASSSGATPWSPPLRLVSDFEADRLSMRWFSGAPVHPRDLAVNDAVKAYVPRAVEASTWSAIAPMARQWVSTVPLEVSAQAVELLKPLSQYLAWRHQGAMNTTDASLVFRLEDIERYIQSGCSHLSDRSRATYKSALRRIGEHAAGWGIARPDQGVPVAAGDPKAPYTPEEFSALLAAIRGRPTSYQRHNAMVIVALARGGGLAAGDIKTVIGHDIERTAAGVVVVHVKGPNPRQVPVLADWADRVERLSALAKGRPLFRSSRREIKRNDIGRFCERLVWRDAPALTITRLRVTWVVEHLEAGTPLHVLADAAGVSAVSLARYAQYAEPVSRAQAHELLARSEGPS